MFLHFFVSQVQGKKTQKFREGQARFYGKSAADTHHHHGYLPHFRYVFALVVYRNHAASSTSCHAESKCRSAGGESSAERVRPDASCGGNTLWCSP